MDNDTVEGELARDTARKGVADIAKETPASFVFLPLLVFVVVPGLVAISNEWRFYYQIHLWAWLVLLAGAIGATTIFVIAKWVLRRVPAAAGVFILFVNWVWFYVVVSGLLFPVAGHTGLIEPTQAPTNEFNLWLCLILATALFIVSETRFGSTLRKFVGGYVLANLALVLFALASVPTTMALADLAVSPTSNVFVVSFDGLDGSAVRAAIANDPEINKALAGFIVFQSVASSSPATSASIAAELLGNRNYKSSPETTGDIWNVPSDQLLTNVLISSGLRVTTYGGYSNGLSEAGQRIGGSHSSGATPLALLNTSLARIGTRALVLEGSAQEVVAGLLTPRVRSSNPESQQTEAVADSLGPWWDQDFALTVFEYEAYVERLSVNQSGSVAVAHFLHFLHTHYPVDFDDDCRYRGNNATWFHGHQNFDGAEAEAICAAHQFAEFVERLDELDILDQSMVVLKSDHGAPVAYSDPGSTDSLRINDHEQWGIGRYRPFLAVKPFGPYSSDVPTESAAPVILDDLARTICEETGIDYDCGLFPGYNVIRDEVPADAEVTVFVVPSPDADYRYASHEAVTIPRGEDIVESLYEALEAGAPDH